MKLDHINEKNILLSVALCGLSVVFAVLICIKVISYFRLSAKVRNIEDIVQNIQARDNNSPDELDKYLRPTKEIANNLKKNNLFVPPQPKQNPVTQIQCIWGDEVFINNKWYKEGDKIQDAKVVSIEPTQATIEWDGKTQVFSPLGASIASNGSNEKAPHRQENVPTPGPRMVTIAPPSQEQPPGDVPSPEVVMVEEPSPDQIPEEVRSVMEQMGIQDFNPTMLQNMSEEQRKQFESMVRMRMERN
jgi:hypothetical protein